MNIPDPQKIVVAGPGLSVAAQVAENIATSVNQATGPTVPDIMPVDVVDRDFVESIGIRTTGWAKAGKAFWMEHSVQFWSAAAGLETGLQVAQTWIPAEWAQLGHIMAITLSWLGILFKLRRQGNLIVDRIREEVRGHTE